MATDSPDGRKPGGRAAWSQGLRPSAHLPPTPRAASGLILFFAFSRGCAHVVRLAPAYIILPPFGGSGIRLAFARRFLHCGGARRHNLAAPQGAISLFAA